MQLIKELEIAYFRSFYKETLYKCSDLNIIFGKNDIGKSNIIRALNLFFNGVTDDQTDFNFDIDFSDKRRFESTNSEGLRKFIYVKITFSTPSNYQRSLGKEFYVKRQWTISRGEEYVEEVSSHIKDSQRHIVTRFMNLIRFIHIPAIKDSAIFRKLLGNIYEILSDSSDFVKNVGDFASRVQSSTSDLFMMMPKEVAHQSKISAPSRMDQLFETLDFETIDSDGVSSKSLTLQRGDGIKARHIPEILKFICDRDRYSFHIWGFEEPENSLDFVSAEAEAKRFAGLSADSDVQVFVTTHSPSFYNLDGPSSQKFYVTRNSDGDAHVVQGRALEKLDMSAAVGEGFYLPVVAKALEQYSLREAEAAAFRAQVEEFREKLAEFKQPIILTEGKTDELILNEAWRRTRGGEKIPFKIKSCDITDGKSGGSAGASRLALSLRAVPHDSANIVIGVFDRDDAGIREWKLDANFSLNDLFSDTKSSIHGMAHGLLLPVPNFRDICAKYNNLPIEYYFQDQHLSVQYRGKGLRLKPVEASRKMGDEIIRIPVGDGTEYMEIVDETKMDFAKFVVPSLPDEAFSAFSLLFDRIQKLI
ncbi:MAG: ATP-dependent nuclease [Mesorhizobium sp.]